VGEVILEQARSPALRGGGNLVIVGRAGDVYGARLLLSSVLGAPPLAGQVAGASPTRRQTLYLVQGGRTTRIRARGGIPSLERAAGDPETARVAAWKDAPADPDWTAPDPTVLLRSMDRFHPIPDAPLWQDSWAEWLYFNGRSPDGSVRFYLTFMVGPRTGASQRTAGVRLQLERNGDVQAFSRRASVPDQPLLESAPDLTIAGNHVRLDGLRYRISLDLASERGGAAVTGQLTLDAPPGRSIAPFTVRGSAGWLSGYVVPVLSGPLAGTLSIGRHEIPLDGAVGYHDHNWGFWRGVTWQWGQVSHEGLSFLYGHIRPPAEALPRGGAGQLPGVLAVIGPDGPIAFARRAAIEETSTGEGRAPEAIRVLAREEGLDVRMEVRVEDVIRTPMPLPGAAVGARTDFLQFRAVFHVSGRIGERAIDFSAPGAAETFVSATTRRARARPQRLER
jgi:hypothetical protein